MSEGVTISYGADKETYKSLVGQDLESGISAARSLLQVSSDIEARFNGREVTDTGVLLRDGDEISFYKASGTKGSN